MSKMEPELIADPETEKQKAWERVADGIWRNNASGMLYERPKVNGNFTFRSLKTKNQKHAKEELHRRRSGVTSAARPSTVTVGAVIRKYQEDDYPDQQRQKRPARMHELEERNCKFLLPFWDKVPVDQVTIANCDRYHDARCKAMVRGQGHRAVDLDLNTLSNAFVWACRCELVKVNPLATRPRYCSEKHVHHCREYMPANADELHKLATLLFYGERSQSEVLGWQALFEAMTGLRTCEALRLRTDAAPYEPGWITPDGKSLCVRRAKGQHNVNPFVEIRDGLRAVLDALFAWKAKRYPKSPWFFPSNQDPNKHVGSTALAHALLRVCKKLGRKVTSHGFRAFYVTVRRSHGVSDVQIAFEIGHTTGGTTLAAVYGGVPPHWLTGDGPKLSWMPTGKPAWEALMQEEVPQDQPQSTAAPVECQPQAIAA